MVLKEVVFNSFSFGRVLVILKELISDQFLLWEECGDLHRSGF